MGPWTVFQSATCAKVGQKISISELRSALSYCTASKKSSMFPPVIGQRMGVCSKLCSRSPSSAGRNVTGRIGRLSAHSSTVNDPVHALVIARPKGSAAEDNNGTSSLIVWGGRATPSKL